MDRQKLTKNFSQRLTKLMYEKGRTLRRASQETINNKQLAEAATCSYQMARKYTLGIALPEIDIVLKIAAWLGTSPAWLLFGEDNYPISKPVSSSTIEIESDILKYILIKGMNLFSKELDEENRANMASFFFSSIKDISHLSLSLDSKATIKVIDILFNSAIFRK